MEISLERTAKARWSWIDLDEEGEDHEEDALSDETRPEEQQRSRARPAIIALSDEELLKSNAIDERSSRILESDRSV